MLKIFQRLSVKMEIGCQGKGQLTLLSAKLGLPKEKRQSDRCTNRAELKNGGKGGDWLTRVFTCPFLNTTAILAILSEKEFNRRKSFEEK